MVNSGQLAMRLQCGLRGGDQPDGVRPQSPNRGSFALFNLGWPLLPGLRVTAQIPPDRREYCSMVKRLRTLLSQTGLLLALAGLPVCALPAAWAQDIAGFAPDSPGAAQPGGGQARETKERPLRSEEHTSELQSLRHLVCRLLLE